MKTTIYKIALLLVCLSFVACSDDGDDTATKKTTTQYSIVGTWLEYAYLNSDGYFTNISNSGYNSYYDFAQDGTFTSWEEYTSGEHFDSASGTWEYSDVENVVLVTQTNGRTWNITLTWTNNDDVRMDIVKSGGSSSSIKTQRVK